MLVWRGAKASDNGVSMKMWRHDLNESIRFEKYRQSSISVAIGSSRNRVYIETEIHRNKSIFVSFQSGQQFINEKSETTDNEVTCIILVNVYFELRYLTMDNIYRWRILEWVYCFACGSTRRRDRYPLRLRSRLLDHGSHDIGLREQQLPLDQQHGSLFLNSLLFCGLGTIFIKNYILNFSWTVS